MKIILIENEETKKTVAYTIIEDIEYFGLKGNELIQALIQVAVDDELLKENIIYTWYESDKIPCNAIRL